jgi:hypothetical protein
MCSVASYFFQLLLFINFSMLKSPSASWRIIFAPTVKEFVGIGFADPPAGGFHVAIKKQFLYT